MLMILNFKQVGSYALTVLCSLAIGYFGCLVFSPPIGNTGADNGLDYIEAQRELGEARSINGTLLEQISNLAGKLDAREVIITGLRSTVSDLERRLDLREVDNFDFGDLVIESGLIADENLYLLDELERSLRKTD